MADEYNLEWTLPISISRCRPPSEKWNAQCPHLDLNGIGTSPREALQDLLEQNREHHEGGGLFFRFEAWNDGKSLDDVVDELLPEEEEEEEEELPESKFKAGERVYCTVCHVYGVLQYFTVVDGDRIWAFKGEAARHYEFDLEPAPEQEEPQPKFKLGDRVQSTFNSTVGTITDVWPKNGSFNYMLEAEHHGLDDWYKGKQLMRLESELELVQEEPHTPEFKVGDRVRDKDDFLKEGVVVRVTKDGELVIRAIRHSCSGPDGNGEWEIFRIPAEIELLDKAPEFEEGDYVRCVVCDVAGTLRWPVTGLDENDKDDPCWEFESDPDHAWHPEKDLVALDRDTSWWERLTRLGEVV